MGSFMNERGHVVGETGHGYWGGTEGSCLGRFHDDGTITQYGQTIGKVDSDGKVYDRYGTLTDYTYSPY